MQRANSGSRPWLEWLALIVVVGAGVTLVLVWAQLGRLGRGSLEPAQTAREYIALTYVAPLRRLDLAASQFRHSAETAGAASPHPAFVARVDSALRSLRTQNARQSKTLDLGAPIGSIERSWAAARTDRYPGNERREAALSTAILDAHAALEEASGLAYDPEPPLQNAADALLVDIPSTRASISGAQTLAENAARRQRFAQAGRLELAVLLDRARVRSVT